MTHIKKTGIFEEKESLKHVENYYSLKKRYNQLFIASITLLSPNFFKHNQDFVTVLISLRNVVSHKQLANSGQLRE